MGKRGMRRWTQEKTGIDKKIINDVRYLMNVIKQTIRDDGWDLSDIGQFRKVRFEIKTSFDPDTMAEERIINPKILTYDEEFDFEIEWGEKTRPFQLVTGYFLKDDNKSYLMDIGDFT
jgi:hypothetical protein